MKKDFLYYMFNIIFSTALIVIIAVFVGMCYILYKGSSEISQNGLRGVIEKVWCGESADCKLPNLN